MASDNVNSPKHYTQNAIECIETIKSVLGEAYGDYCRGNVIKYVWRYKDKNGLEDLKKGQWYYKELVKHEEKKMEKSKTSRQSTER